MASPAENPFTALTIVVAPAILTNASSLLCFGTAKWALAGGQHRCYIIKDGFAGGKLHSQEVSH
ncbi:MAG: hypothetical protein DME87_12580 [Verrucomicrobia bacterium]|nr:MAG: hypothetical protein DME87_12580 [Verrucomicrobiota bacterium]